MATVTEQLEAFLTNQPNHNGLDLLARWSPGMETQVNVAAGDGEKLAGKGSVYVNSAGEKWWAIRIPKKANTPNPEFNDYQLDWPIERHADSIGMTGWHWRDKTSRFVGFDFDAITGHAQGVGVSDDELERVRIAAQALDYVEVRKSTSGTGLHFYVLLDSIPTESHTEHAALARAILSQMSADAGFDFARQIDVCGSNMWVWSRRTAGTDGFSLIKPSTKTLTADDLPFNWRNHKEVVARKRSKVQIDGLSEASQMTFDRLASARKQTPLDETHKRIIQALADTGYATAWQSDFHCIHTHTKALAKVGETLGVKGCFRTNSPGGNPDQANCFAFPIAGGAFSVYRFGQGTIEDSTWKLDSDGYSSCYFNRDPDLATAVAANGGFATSDGYAFNSATEAAQALEALETKIEVPAALAGRETHIIDRKGALVVRVSKESNDTKPPLPWSGKRGVWELLAGPAPENAETEELQHADDVVRIAVSPTGDSAGAYVRSLHESWDRHPTPSIKMVLQALGHDKANAEKLIGAATLDRWQLVSLPFQPEFPGGRVWNKGAAQFRANPAPRGDVQHPTWDKYLNHLGGTLDNVVAGQEWARKANIKTGGDYLRAWIASLIRHPFDPLPYLFLWSHGNEQGVCGKSLFWESIDRCLFSGIVRGENALTHPSGFNGELEHGVLVALDDFNASNPRLYNKLKDLITSRLVHIRRMRTDGFSILNKLHFVQTANGLEQAPAVVDGDTRIVPIYCRPVPAADLVPKAELMAQFETEAPAFLRTLLDYALPKPQDRLRLPALETSDKQTLANAHRTALERFLIDRCYHVPGARTLYAEVWNEFLASLADDSTEQSKWGRNRFTKLMPSHFPIGRSTGNKTFIGNLSLSPSSPLGEPWYLLDGQLKR